MLSVSVSVSVSVARQSSQMLWADEDSRDTTLDVFEQAALGVASEDQSILHDPMNHEALGLPRTRKRVRGAVASV